MRYFTFSAETIEIEFRPFAALAWLGAGFEVRVGGRRFHPKLDRLGLNTATDFDFDVDGRRISGCVRSLAPMWFAPRILYAIVVDGKEVARGSQVLKRWYFCYLAWALLFTTVLLAGLGTLALTLGLKAALQ